MYKKFVLGTRYNITRTDIEKGVEDRGYIDNNPNTSNKSNPLDKWYKYEAGRDDFYAFPSPTDTEVILTRAQVHDSINRLFNYLRSMEVNLSVDPSQNYQVGYNYNTNKIFNLVEEQLLLDPQNVLAFTKDPTQFILTIAGLDIKNILIHEGSAYRTNDTLPFLKTDTGGIVGHHKDGMPDRGLQGTFTEAKVGGYKHRHHPIASTIDRPERFNISDNGTTITLSSPISGASGLNYNIPYSRISRDGFTKSPINIKNIRISSSNTLGNYKQNYENLSGINRKIENLAFIQNVQTYPSNSINTPFLSGNTNFAVPSSQLADGNYSETVFVYKFGAPGEVNTTAKDYLDPQSGEMSPNNVIDYRNNGVRKTLRNYLVTSCWEGGYTSGSYGTTASFHKTERNNRRLPISGTSNFGIVADNWYVNYPIPFSDSGYQWVANYTTGGNNPGLYVNKDYNINYITNSVDNIGFSLFSSSFYSFSGLTSSLDTTDTSVLRKYNVKINGLWNYSSKQQLSNHDNKINLYNVKNNIYVDQIDTDNSNYPQTVQSKFSPISDKYMNTENVYVDENGNIERLSYQFAQNYASIMPNCYDASQNKIVNFYKIPGNIKYADKSNSIFKRLLNYDRLLKKNNIPGKKLTGVKYGEKIYPKGQNVFRNFSMTRNAYTQSWADSLDNRLTELTNSQGQVYVRTAFLNKESGGTEYKFSYWPMDANLDPNYPGAIVRDKSGELLQIDNINFYNTRYGVDPGLIVPSGSYFGARFGRNWNTNRPANVVHEQAGRGPYHNSYENYYYDIKLIGHGCSVLPEYRISPRLDTYYSTGISFYSDTFNTLELTGTVIEDASIAISTSSAFLEQRVNSDYIDLNEYLNQELTEFKLDKIKLKVKGIKKFLPYDGFYPQQRMLKLATQFSSSYNGLFTLQGTQPTFRTVLTPFYAPGIAFNSIKAGIGMPFNVAYDTPGAGDWQIITSSLTTAASYYYKLPWDTILYPYKRLQEIYSSGPGYISDIDPNMIIDSYASIRAINSSNPPQYNLTYDYMANNFYSEVVNFFKDSRSLSSLRSRPSNEWYFPDLTKKYAIDIVITKQGNFTTYTSNENYGPKPYAFHAPPWNYADTTNSTASAYNSDVSLRPNDFGTSAEVYAQILFDPQSLAVGDLDYFLKGKFNIGDVIRNSSVGYTSSMYNNTSSATVQINDLVDLFSVSADGVTWQPKIKWECPTADLNFYNLSAKLTNSSGNDSGGSVVGNAIRGIWHQYAPISNNNDGLFLTVRNSNVNTALTGSLLDVVGFDKSITAKIGKIAPAQIISETLLVIPYYLNDCGEEKFFDIEDELFERLYSTNTGIVGEIKSISRRYILPPQMDFIKYRDQAGRRLQKADYGSVKSPFIMFPFEFKATLSQQDLADIWQGVLPSSATTAEVEYLEKDFFIGNYLKELNFKLPDNTRFKVFKVKKKALTNYQEVDLNSLGYNYVDPNYGYNWPYDFFSLLEMAEIKVELNYGTDITEDTNKLDINDITRLEVQNALQRSGIISPETATVLARDVGTVSTTGMIETATAIGSADFTADTFDTTELLRRRQAVAQRQEQTESSVQRTERTATALGSNLDFTTATATTSIRTIDTSTATLGSTGGSTSTFAGTPTTDTGTNTRG